MSFIVETNQQEILDVTFMGFAGGERHVQLPEIEQFPVESIAIKALVANANDVMDLMLVVNALRHRLGNDLAIDLTIPYLPYARQDRVCAKGQAFSMEVFAAMLSTLKARKITTWDCHSDVGVALTGANNISPEDIILKAPALVGQLQAENGVLICPDNGAKARCANIQRALKLENVVACDKKRDPATGRIIKTEVGTASLAGKTAIITDDICDGGFTFIKLAEQLRAKGAKKVVLYVTHGIFSKGVAVFDGLIDEIYTTTSFTRDTTGTCINEIQF